MEMLKHLLTPINPLSHLVKFSLSNFLCVCNIWICLGFCRVSLVKLSQSQIQQEFVKRKPKKRRESEYLPGHFDPRTHYFHGYGQFPTAQNNSEEWNRWHPWKSSHFNVGQVFRNVLPNGVAKNIKTSASVGSDFGASSSASSSILTPPSILPPWQA